MTLETGYLDFPTDYASILSRIERIDPGKYARTRNYIDGAVTYLSPYISRGVISTKQVLEHIMALGLPWEQIEKLIQELAWRDYWQQVWISKGEEIFHDLRHPQTGVLHEQIPTAVLEANTGIRAVDRAIQVLYDTGYMHNHMRMYVASMCCNIGGAHWSSPATWMYSHLLDGDLASNHLSWQWVAGTNAKKKYYANQDNINRFFHSDQKGTFLDVGYEEFADLPVPDVLKEVTTWKPSFTLPAAIDKSLYEGRNTLIYNYYNLDPNWHPGEDYQRVLLLEPSFFRKYPVSQKCLDFVLDLGSHIKGLQVFVGEFGDLLQKIGASDIYYKEHPTNSHYTGAEEARDWMSPITGYFPSFFGFWKRCKKHLIG